MSHKLAVIIVNYNVAFFLEQCLHSVLQASTELDTEIWVVDNDSKDGSVEMVMQKFPEIKLIANKDNLGFSKANNQAIRKSNSQYVLLLNPDTLVEEDTFKRAVDFMDTHPDAGGLGVKMIDGKGEFLPESKRGLPTPSVAFYKIFGLAKLFPKSKKFGQYHLGFLDKDKNHSIDILSGAFMLMRQSVLDEVGLLDETFFMYGEDIDLSYRIIKAGYKNYYFADTRIIHYKGESTKKSSINYIFVFYKAMVIFAEKHFSSKNAKLFSALINIAIWLRAGLAVVYRFIQRVMVPLLDLALLLGGLFIVKHFYEQYTGISYSNSLYPYAFLIYGLIWVSSMYFNGSYDKPLSIKKNITGLIYGTGIILIIYSLLPEHLRFSRAIILLGSISSALLTFISRRILSLISSDYSKSNSQDELYLIVGKKAESQRVSSMLEEINIAPEQIDQMIIADTGKNKSQILNTLIDYVRFNHINEVVFCAKDISAQEIIEQMSKIDNTETNFKIAPPESLFIIGSNSSNTSGDFLAFDLNSVANPSNQRKKRSLDLGLSIILLIASPLLIWGMNRKSVFIKNIFSVLIGKKTWVGYNSHGDGHIHLPKIKEGILHPTIGFSHTITESSEKIDTQNMLYAKDYSPRKDLGIILDQWRYLGGK